MMKQAAQQALEALLALHAEGARVGWHLHPKWEAQMRAASDSINTLRTAIQQAEARTDEPAGAREALERIASWREHPAMLGVDYGSNGVRDYYRKIARDALTHPAPGVPTVPADELRRLHAGVERLRKLVPDVELAREAIYAKAEGREA